MTYCPGCGVKIDLQEESWRRSDGPCIDGQYWCIGTTCNPPFTCGCVTTEEIELLERVERGRKRFPDGCIGEHKAGTCPDWSS